ncbi:MAG: YkgJ family cysteine cluster protein [Desulfatitalea sp.]|nr:YkgJ family cysteine cluster protein [Desulfatitalea sp.]
MSACASDFFECTQCGQCCKGYGGTYVSDADIAAIAQFLGLSIASVRNRNCVLSGGKSLLAQRPDGYCIFFGQNCGIHPVKPRMCRRWPFIPGVLVDVGNWRAMADSCPGIRADVDERALRHYVQYTLDLENR